MEVIKCSGISKRYEIYENPKDRLKQAIFKGRRQYFKEFWALRNIDLEVKKGESLGIIGRNGSGKSTLLQIICGTLTPTEGEVRTNGKVAALLELGSGFNPEFTGIENVFLNASMLGLKKTEIENRLDNILGFADIGDFVNQPVKTYSSGMAVRLAFAVISHVDADILIVDEALAVGDIFFTQKCMRYINRFRDEGSLLFVSHDAGSVASLCDKALLLESGKMQMYGKPKDVLNTYNKKAYIGRQELEICIQEDKIKEEREDKSLEAESDNESREIWIDYRKDIISGKKNSGYIHVEKFSDTLMKSESFGNGNAMIEDIRLLQGSTEKPILFGNGGEIVKLNITARAIKKIEKPIVGFILKNERGLVLLGENSLNSKEQLSGGNKRKSIEEGTSFLSTFEFTLPLLPAGKYSFTVSIADGGLFDHQQLQWMNDALIFESTNTTIAAGLAGVPMHSIKITY